MRLKPPHGHAACSAASCETPNPVGSLKAMAKVLVLYYSSYGHIERMAEAAAEGAREAGAQVDVKRVPETWRLFAVRP